MSETDPREVEAARLKLNYIGLDGSIGCLGNILCILDQYSILTTILSLMYIIMLITL